ncbi:MAG: phosphotransferase [Paramuribaculum sp.]|nr:phosphotransferase [Paramuribaculum sp.]
MTDSTSQKSRENALDALLKLAEENGYKVTDVLPLAAAGSARSYFRLLLDNGSTLVGAWGPDRRENDTFVYLSRLMKGLGLNVVNVIAESPDYGVYLMEDLGDRLLFDAIAPGRTAGDWSGEPEQLLEATVRALPAIQCLTAETIDMSRCYPRDRMDYRAVMWDLNYFKYCFLKATGVSFDENLLEDEMERLGHRLSVGSNPRLTGFSMRDCQSRNVMIASDGSPWFIDYQGGRIASVAYDVASLLRQARAAIPDWLCERLVGCYLEELRKFRDVTEEEFDDELTAMVVFRMLQVLGAYGLRGITEGKTAFMESIPNALATLMRYDRWLESNGLIHLNEVLHRVAEMPRFRVQSPRQHLRVTVYSFSYKRGMPYDESGNGGGFVFDCRAPHNPGRYERYRSLTGLSSEVREFLEEKGEMPRLVAQAVEIVASAVERYLERGFTSLQVAFGCTGGQHRSVYGADNFSRIINQRFGVEVKVIHREQAITQILPAGLDK